MRVEIRADNSVKISGYVNAVCRDSRPIYTARGRAVEQIEAGVFQRAIQHAEERGENIALRMNHIQNRDYAGTLDGTLILKEDSIGLRAEAIVTDSEMFEKAKNKEFRGWSFGCYVTKDHMEERAEDIPRRHVQDMELFEVSLIDHRKNPCYTGTSIEERADTEVIIEERSMEDEPEVETPEKKHVDYSEYETRLSKCKGE